MASAPLPTSQQEHVRAFLRWAIPGVWGTQTAAGTALKMSQEYISQLKSGKKNIGATVALKIAVAANVPFESLVEGRAIRLLERPRYETTEASVVAMEHPTRSYTPTPIPSSKIRYVESETGPTNRDIAVKMLTQRGYDREIVESEMALAALDRGVPFGEDRPVHWWIDSIRGKVAATVK